MNKSSRQDFQGIVDRALRLVCANQPHLAGLARRIRVYSSNRVEVAAVSASGIVLVNPLVLSSISLPDAAFVLAHEIMHLALDTHGRAGDANLQQVNMAHDYIINDMLADELEMTPPLGGLFEPGARYFSLEEMMIRLAKQEPATCWRTGMNKKSSGTMSRALQDAGLIVPKDSQEENFPWLKGDLIPLESESELEPHLDSEKRESLRHEIRGEAVQALSAVAIRNKLEAASAPEGSWNSRVYEKVVESIRSSFQTPWEQIMQRWFDSQSSVTRTYARPSRRMSGRSDAIRPGRTREGWTLNIILDTSGSMEDELGFALGAIAMFGEANGMDSVRILQCDEQVTADQRIEIEELRRFRAVGFGGSDMSPALEHLSEDPDVTGVIVITDGGINYPSEEPPYQVLWVVCENGYSDFRPAYGQVVHLRSIADRLLKDSARAR